jgi:hypothetical protein
MLSYTSREAILRALHEMGGDEGLVGFIKKLAQDPDRALRLVELVTPRPVEMAVHRTEVHHYETLEQVNESLRQIGIVMPAVVPDWIGDDPIDGEVIGPNNKT